LAVAVVVALLELAAAGLIRLVSPRLDVPIRTVRSIYADQSEEIRRFVNPDTPRVLMPDSLLGWRYRPGWSDPVVLVNAAGLRGNREYAITPDAGRTRVAAFGDSFVFGSEVAWFEAWPALLERADSTVEVLNYGVGAYGLDQAFLRYLAEGQRFAPHVVLICFSTDDLRRVVSVYRRFVGEGPPLFKPRFRLDAAGELVLEPSPIRHPADYQVLLEHPEAIREIGARDAWYEPLVYENPMHDYSAMVRLATATWIRFATQTFRVNRLYEDGAFRPASEAFQLHLPLFRAFHDSVTAHGRHPMIVFLPDEESLLRARAGGQTIYEPLVAALRTAGLPVHDAVEAFLEEPGPPSAWFMPGRHYSPSGNRLVAEWLAARIPRQLP